MPTRDQMIDAGWDPKELDDLLRQESIEIPLCDACGEPLSDHIGDDKTCPWPKSQHPRPACKWVVDSYNEWNATTAYKTECKADNFITLFDPREITYCPYCGGKLNVGM